MEIFLSILGVLSVFSFALTIAGLLAFIVIAIWMDLRKETKLNKKRFIYLTLFFLILEAIVVLILIKLSLFDEDGVLPRVVFLFSALFYLVYFIFVLIPLPALLLAFFYNFFLMRGLHEKVFNKQRFKRLFIVFMVIIGVVMLALFFFWILM